MTSWTFVSTKGNEDNVEEDRLTKVVELLKVRKEIVIH